MASCNVQYTSRLFNPVQPQQDMWDNHPIHLPLPCQDPKDIQPYLPLLLPQLKLTLVDPIPDVFLGMPGRLPITQLAAQELSNLTVFHRRATSAKAFGILAQVLPEDMLGEAFQR